MSKYDALFEDEDDIFAGTPKKRYWDIVNQLSDDLIKDEFDGIVQRLAVMESMLSKTHDYEMLDKIIQSYALENMEEIEELKKSVYLELAGQLIYRVSE
ncbi:hypothetical protein MNB_SM-3-630 [hydrothermal vent metagenome]|uniref:DUF2018 domain-containing protein n=1 Tax=hydrothermal vent metagenome TaxID=652676 RepID=A0A1W1BJU9_9ZZZZ